MTLPTRLRREVIASDTPLIDVHAPAEFAGQPAGRSPTADGG